MRRSELADLVARATEATGEDQVYIIGSQAILASYDESQLPPNIWRSPEADMFPLRDDDNDTVSNKMLIYSEISHFGMDRGYFIDPVSRSTAALPDGWDKRVIKFRVPPPTGSPRNSRRTGLCLEKHDLCATKLARFEAKDKDYTEALVRVGLVDATEVDRRVAAIPVERFQSPTKRAIVMSYCAALVKLSTGAQERPRTTPDVTNSTQGSLARYGTGDTAACVRFMPRAKTGCALKPGHRGHHRSKLPNRHA